MRTEAPYEDLRPLLFSMLIIVTSFLPIFFLGAREGRLFNPLAFSKTFAMAFSTLLTLFLLPAIIAWVFKRNIAPADGPAESRYVRGYRRALVATNGGAVELDAADGSRLARFDVDGLPVWATAYLPDGDRVLVTRNGVIAVLDEVFA